MHDQQVLLCCIMLFDRAAWRSVGLDRNNNTWPLQYHLLDSTISPDLTSLYDVLVSTITTLLSHKHHHRWLTLQGRSVFVQLYFGMGAHAETYATDLSDGLILLRLLLRFHHSSVRLYRRTKEIVKSFELTIGGVLVQLHSCVMGCYDQIAEITL